MGSCHYKDDEVEVIVTFNANGTFRRKVSLPDQTITVDGTWKLDGDRLVIKPQDAAEVTLEAVRVDARQLSFQAKDAGQPVNVTMKRLP